MYLKSLEIHGFKSFPDKIKLTFDKGITAVVGPNGSGKSNIGDAMRWVLGEQSTKTLRGNKMEDVIFSGTASRKPVGFASVTLTIDNSNHEFDVEGDEVVVMRKLYRSGESEYKINGKNSRLKDINELFMDTGLGRDGYSIIGQGRIAEIVSAKSNERRDIFEEAAGISKFRYKKSEAEKKLAQAQDNLLRLKDIVSGLEERINPLKIQAEKARQFIVLANERKKIEISVWIAKLSELRKSIDETEEKLLICRSQYESAEHDMEDCEFKRRQCDVLIRECTEKAEQLRKEILETEKKSSEYKSGIAVCENDILYCKKSTISLLEKQTELNLKKTETQKSLEESNKKKFQFEQSADEISNSLEQVKNEFAEIEKESESLGKISDEKSEEINALYIKQSEYRLTVNSSESIISEIQSQIDSIKKQTDDYESVKKKYEYEQTEVKKSIEYLSELEQECKNKINGYNILVKNKINKSEEHKKEYNKLLFDMNSVQQKIKILTDLENSMEGFSYSVKEIMKASSNGYLRGVRGTVAQLINVDSKYSVAIETALGGALQNIIVDNEQSAKDCINYLKQHKAGRSTFLPITSVKGYELAEQNVRNEFGFIAIASEIALTDVQYSGIIKSLLGRTVIADDLNSATNIAQKYRYKFKIVTLDGQVVNAGGSFTGGSQSRSTGVLSRKNEIEKLNSQLLKSQSDKEAYEQTNLKIQQEINNINTELKNIQEELEKISADKINFVAEEKRLLSMSEQAGIQFKESGVSLNILNKRLETQNSMYKNAVEELETVESKILEAENSIAIEKDKKEAVQKKREQLSAQLSDLRIKQMEILKNAELVENEIKTLSDTIKQCDDENLRVIAEIDVQKRVTAEKESQIEKFREKLEEVKITVEKISVDIEKQREIQLSHEADRDKINNDIKNLNDTKESLTKELTRLEERRSSAVKESDSVVSQIWDSYEMTRSEAENIAEPIENMIKAQKQLNEVRAKIKSLGNVNVDAIDEYKEVSERYEFMTSQLKDVEDSRDELIKLIENLTEDMCRMFSECFADINKNFKCIFKELFGGGDADLILSDPDNVLESGIEIRVAPPGKVIKNLISLSGGEQSFIAIAIYFAILKVRPAPFCILDEIDAALDDVNVSKYASYLKNFINSTQFITVTHRRGTMDCANVLYGVTMQENGISKLLKLDNSNIADSLS